MKKELPNNINGWDAKKIRPLVPIGFRKLRAGTQCKPTDFKWFKYFGWGEMGDGEGTYPVQSKEYIIRKMPK